MQSGMSAAAAPRQYAHAIFDDAKTNCQAARASLGLEITSTVSTPLSIAWDIMALYPCIKIIYT